MELTIIVPVTAKPSDASHHPFAGLISNFMQDSEIINRVSNSGLLQLNPEEWYDTRPRFSFDLADFLFQGLVLKELDFREALKVHSWEQYAGGIICVHCSADAIVPTWAFMLVALHAGSHADLIECCRPEELDRLLFDRKIQSIDLNEYAGKRVIVKGCSKNPVPESAFVSLAARLRPVVQSLMFGEPCSNVPLYKKKKQIDN